MKVSKIRNRSQKVAKFTIEFRIYADDAVYTMASAIGMYSDDTYDTVLERLRKYFPTKQSLVDSIKSHAKAGGDNYNELIEGGVENVLSDWGNTEETDTDRTKAFWDHGKRIFPSLFN